MINDAGRTLRARCANLALWPGFTGTSGCADWAHRGGSLGTGISGCALNSGGTGPSGPERK